jgi:rhamnopyranosyl-N-acetylglucosaminyl-diphospho-decaprenol beta-1,3/1,4-galactofuranosyltransferase
MKIVTVTATYRRPKEIARLLAALRKSIVPIHGVVVVDNANDVPTQLAVAQGGLAQRYVAAGTNLGCGGGLRLAEETALREFPELTHVWILDDDTVPEPDTLQTLLAAMASRDVGATCPQATDAEGRLNWFPGLLDRAAFKVLRNARTPDDFLVRWGGREEAFSWATGVALLVTRRALEAAGLHRGDFWMRGEDLDFSLRVTAQFRGLYVPGARLAHLPPGGGRVVDDFAERMKHAAMLQNCAYLAARTSHGRSLAKHWLGNALRHWKRFGFGAIGDVLRAAWLGAVRGRPAGVPRGEYFRRRLEAAPR